MWDQRWGQRSQALRIQLCRFGCLELVSTPKALELLFWEQEVVVSTSVEVVVEPLLEAMEEQELVPLLLVLLVLELAPH